MVRGLCRKLSGNGIEGEMRAGKLYDYMARFSLYWAFFIVRLVPFVLATTISCTEAISQKAIYTVNQGKEQVQIFALKDGLILGHTEP